MYVVVGMWVGLWVCTPDRNVLKLGIVVAVDTVSQPTDFEFKMSRFRVGVRKSAPLGNSRECTHLLVFYSIGYEVFVLLRISYFVHE